PLESPKKWERQSRFAPTVFLIHFFSDSSGWSEADFVTGSPSALRYFPSPAASMWWLAILLSPSS
ncbi:hypothetical protein, partial [Herbaspirillum chlorophenolicum]